MGKIQAKEFKIKDGSIITICNGSEDEWKDLFLLAKSVVDEDIFQLTTSDEFNISEENDKSWIRAHNDNPHYLLLVAKIDHEILGILDFSSGHRKRISHTGEMGISVHKNYRNLGVGTLLLQSLIEWAESTEFIEKINIQVHVTNVDAIRVYKKMGFVTEGHKKNELKYGKNEYIDTLLMAKFVATL